MITLLISCICVCFLFILCRSLSTLWCRRNTLNGVESFKNKDCTSCGWRGTRPSLTSPSILKTQPTSSCMTRSCSASSTRAWWVNAYDSLLCQSLCKKAWGCWILSKIFQYLCFCLCVYVQPLPEAKTMLFNQMTLRSLPEAERKQHSHAFKICKNYQVYALKRQHLKQSISDVLEWDVSEL